MGLFSFFKKRGDRQPSGEQAATASRSEVDVLRTRARRRLVGAMVLVIASVVGFPLLFETQPRPLRTDLPIQIVPRTVAVVPMAAPPVRVAEPASAPIRNEPPADKHDEVAGAASVPAAAAPVASAPAVAGEAPAADSKPVNSQLPASTPRPTADAVRAQAALEGREAPTKPAERSAPASNRFVVQVGAFAEADTARDVRGRVERLGLRTYTQEVDTGSGRRIRVRVGPFTERDQADRTAAKNQGLGLVGRCTDSLTHE